MPFSLTLVRLLYIITICVQVSLLVVIFRRRQHRNVPLFTAYVAIAALGQLVSYVFFETATHTRYFVVAWIAEFAALLLSFASIGEAYWRGLAFYQKVRSIGARILLSTTLVLILLAIILLPYGAEHSKILEKVPLLIERSGRMVQVGVVAVFFAFTRYLGIRWRHHLFGIVLGFGLYSAVNVSVVAFSAQRGRIVGYHAMLIESLAMILTNFVWIGYFVQPEPAPSIVAPQEASQLEPWSKELTTFLR